METRIALIGIIVTSHESIQELNTLLSEYGSYIVGRMGIPYREKNVSIISIAIDAPNDVISSLSGKIGMLPGLSTKTVLIRKEDSKAYERIDSKIKRNSKLVKKRMDFTD
jgi:putative iron-only hydrogenase system regulator